MTEMYVVIGSAGVYSDRDVWAVAVFTDEERAKEFVDEVSAQARQAVMQLREAMNEWMENDDDWPSPEDEAQGAGSEADKLKWRPKLDPHCRVDLAGYGDELPQYWLEPVPGYDDR